MAIIIMTNRQQGYARYPFAGVPSSGTSEVDTLTLDATGGTFKLAFSGFTTTAISWNATNATLLASINAALVALPSVGASAITATAGTLTAGVGTVLLTFSGNLGTKAVSTVSVANNSLTGNATCTIAKTTPGVDATARGQIVAGGELVDTTNKILYINTGTVTSPVYTKVGTQT